MEPISEGFIAILKAAGVTAVHQEDGGRWLRFELDGRKFEAGAKGGKWVVIAEVGKLTSDPAKLGALTKAISRTNGKLPKKISHGRLAEADAWLRASSEAPLEWLQSDPSSLTPRLERVLMGARLVASHESAAKLVADFPNALS